jgi:hypothetical protein
MVPPTSHSAVSPRAPRKRRGAALLLAIFSMVVVGTTTAAYVSSRETSVAVARNAQTAADSRALAAAGLDLTARILRDPDSTWRTAHSNGNLLRGYSLDDGTVSVQLVDIERRDAGMANVNPTSQTTEVEATVTSTRNGSTWTTVANLSIPSVASGQYAIFADRYLGVVGNLNRIGRWQKAPLAAEKLRVNIGTNAVLGRVASVSLRVNGSGINLDTGLRVEAEVAGADVSDPRSSQSTWAYYPSNASGGTVFGSKTSDVATEQMDPDDSVALITAPAAPSISGAYTSYTSNRVRTGVTETVTPFRVRAVFLPQIFTRNYEVRGNSVITLTTGTYEIWGSWILRDSRIIIQGDVKVVVNPNLALTGLDWQNSSVELNANSTLEIYNGYSCDVRNCWMGARYICTNEPNATTRDGDGHKAAWFGTFQPTVCQGSAPTEPEYIEPWRIRIYPMPQFLSSAFNWDFTDSSIVGSLYLPTNPIRLYGRTVIWGRIAARDVLMHDQSCLYYDHMLDEVSGLTEGSAPSRGGEPDQMYPMRVVRYGFDAEGSR